MIYVTGDTHSDYTRFSTENFPEQRGMTKEDFVIVCGDFGYWRDDREQAYWMDWLESKPFTTLFVDGNHENFDLLYRLPRETRYGGEVHVVRPSVLHLMRGQRFTIGGCSVFAMGGAASHDIRDGILEKDDPQLMEKRIRLNRQGKRLYRINHVSWWQEELPSDEEYRTAEETLDKWDWEADFIISHCASGNCARQLLGTEYRPDRLTEFFDRLEEKGRFSCWLFGHYHDNRKLDNRHICLYEQIVKLRD